VSDSDLLQQLKDELQKRDQVISDQAKRIAELEDALTTFKDELEKWKRGHRIREGGKLSQKKKKLSKPLGARKPGRKKGHEGAGRQAPKHVDRYVDVPAPSVCPSCQSSTEPCDEAGLHKVEELIPARVEVIGYQRHASWCPCCKKKVRSPLPDGLGHNPKVGLVAQATITQDRAELGLTLGQIKKLRARDGLQITTGGIQQILHRSAEILKPAMEQIKEGVRQSTEAWADETPWRIWGTVGYMWLVMTQKLVYYESANTRAQEVIQEMLKGFTGRLHSDFYAVYFTLKVVQHVLCWSHLLRKAEQNAEREERGTRCARFHAGLQEIYREACEAQKKEGAVEAAKELQGKLEELGKDEELGRNKEVAKLQERVVLRGGDLLRFVEDERLEGTNNRAEREFRMLAMMRHVCGGAKSEEGGKTFAVLLSVFGTLCKQGRELLRVWLEARTAYYNQGPYPTITPPRPPPSLPLGSTPLLN
jgi:hypothetical protein